MKNRKIMLVVLAFSMLLSACGAKEATTTTNENIVNEGTSTDASWSENIIQKSLCDNVTVDAKVIVPEGFKGAVNIYDAGVEGIQKDLAFQTFQIEQEKATQVAEGLYAYNDSFIEFSDAVSGSFSYTAKGGEQYKTYDDYEAEESKVANVGENVELTFMSRQDAENKAKKILAEIGINETAVTHIFALPVAYHQYVENTEVKEGVLESSKALGRQWENLGDCYEVQLTTQYDGIPLCEEGYIAADDSGVNGGKITAIISTEGVQQLDVPNQYIVDNKTVQEQKILTTQDILEKLKNKMENIILTDEYTVTKLELCYYPKIMDKEKAIFKLIPVWEITLNGEEDGEITYIFQASDGTEI